MPSNDRQREFFEIAPELPVEDFAVVPITQMGPRLLLMWRSLELRTPTMLRIVECLTEAEMRWIPPNNSNSISWLLWHIAEVEDNWVRDKVLGLEKRFPFGSSVRSTEMEAFPDKPALLSYFRSVRSETKQRLGQSAEEDFDRLVQDEHFGAMTVGDVWAGVVTSCAWHSGQIALTSRLVPNST